MEKVVVTGATKGIGRAIAEKFASQGAQVAICARHENDLEAVAAQLHAKYPDARIIYQKCDVARREELNAFGQFVLEHFGSVDILVNNAGIFMPGQIQDEAEGVLESTVETNVYSAYHLTRQLLPQMIEAGKGHIFNMCSTASLKAYINGGSYCISKFALLGMTKVLREELKPHNIKVTAIYPGPTYTHSWAGAGLPEERFMKAQDVAEVVWAASKLSPNAVMEEILMRPMQGDI